MLTMFVNNVYIDIVRGDISYITSEEYDINKEKNMNVDQHIKVAQWHLEQARLHATQDGYSCGCPITDEYKKEIEAVESGLIKEEK